MIQRMAMMLIALAAGTFLSAVVDANPPGREPADSQDASGAAKPSAADADTGNARLTVPQADDDQTGQTDPDADEIEVKTSQVLTGDKFTDGQAPAETAPVAAARIPAPTALPITTTDVVVADAEAAGEPAVPQPAPVPQTIFTDYKTAMKVAAEDRKLLFIYFHDSRPNPAQRAFETHTLADEQIKEKLQRYVVLRLPREAAIVQDDKQVKLLQHAAFAEMLGRQGVAMIDLAHETADYYGHVVSTFPFTPGKYYRKEALSIILDLPPGTLTQRTMIYAVRIHPEAPASTQGIFHTVLADEAKEHANYQASILLQGHHSWDSRFHRINSKLPGGVLAQEVVAESWPNESLVEAAVDCVHSWRQSPGHWGAVRSRQPLFGYDIKRGRNGIWYATGIFGRR